MASTSVAAIFPGNVCPNKCSFTRCQGPNAGIGQIEVDGDIDIPSLGTAASIQVGPSTFYGTIVKTEITETAADGKYNRVQLVDWRDRLKDTNFFGAFNMIDESGRWWHIYCWDWPTQVKTYIKEVYISDINNHQNIVPDDWSTFWNLAIDYFTNGGQYFNIANATGIIQESYLKNRTIRQSFPLAPISAATIVNLLALFYNFQWKASEQASNILLNNWPHNLDWNHGDNGANCLETVCDKCGLQYMAYGTNNIYISLRGFPETAIESAFLSGYGNICTYGAIEGAGGTEFNDAGRRVVIIGEPNKYEAEYLCVANWAPGYDWDFCHDGVTFNAYMTKYNLDASINSIDDLHKAIAADPTFIGDPDDFVDNDWYDSLPRIMNMTIYDYINIICFRSYVVDFNRLFNSRLDESDPGLNANGVPNIIGRLDLSGVDRETLVTNVTPDSIVNYTPNLSDIIGETIHLSQLLGVNVSYIQDWTTNPSFSDYHSLWPISRGLLSDSDYQFKAKNTSRAIVQGQDENNPAAASPQLLGSTSVNVKIEIRAVSDTDLARATWRVVLYYDDPVYLDMTSQNPQLPFVAPPAPNIVPDIVTCLICIDRELYTFVQGDSSQSPRIREQRHVIENLNDGFIYDSQPSQEGLGINSNYAWQPQALLTQNFALQLQHKSLINFQLVASTQTVTTENAVTADDIAGQLATQLLAHNNINLTGYLVFEGSTGYMPDGCIDSVYTTFDAVNGVRETVNFTNSTLELEGNGISYKQDSKRYIEPEKFHHRDAGNAVLRKGGGIKTVAKAHDKPGGRFANTERSKQFGRDESVQVAIGQNVFNNTNIYDGTVLICGNPPQLG